MKKKILILVFLVLFTTGCTCEYNLNIVDNNYSETITLTADNEQELNSFNVNWKIPTDKDEYGLGEKSGVTPKYQSDLYDYKLSNNTLIFSHIFDKESITKSSAISNCYNMLNVDDYESTIMISTSSKLNCFNYYPELNKITVTIETDKEVISHNADYVNENKYIWYLNKNNTDKKPINMTIDNTSKEVQEETIDIPQNNNETKTKKQKSDYTLYIFCGILLIIMLGVYYIYNKMKNKSEMDD